MSEGKKEKRRIEEEEKKVGLDREMGLGMKNSRKPLRTEGNLHILSS